MPLHERMIHLAGHIHVHPSELTWDYVRSPGPGGQNVNKTSSTAVLRFDVAGSPSLGRDVKDRLLALAGSRRNARGEIVIRASRHRSRERNRIDALDHLRSLVERALSEPAPRVPTKPGAASARARLETKRLASRRKAMRRRDVHDDDA
mgnify:CR=1 FL=1